MNYHVRLFRGIKQPNIGLYQLNKAESVTGFWPKAIILLIASALIYGIGAYFGVGTEYISSQIGELGRDEFEMHKALFLIGQILWGLFYAVVIVALPALFFWSLSDTNLKKLMVTQFFVLIVLLLEDAILIPVTVFLGIGEISSPFSLGVLTQYITTNEFVVYFFASISLFKVLVILIQYKALKALTEKSTKFILASVLSLNLVLWLFSALFSYVQFEKLF